VVTLRDVTTSSAGGQHPITWVVHIPGPRDPLPAQFTEWLEWLAVIRNRPATTIRSYLQALAKFVAFLGTQVDLRRTVELLAPLCGGVRRSDFDPKPIRDVGAIHNNLALFEQPSE
jgi:hypothetical protein